jgi:hypothetical protein
VIALVRPPKFVRSARRKPLASRDTEIIHMNTDDLDNFEADREYKLAQEYQDVVGMFKYAVETERRFYLANAVSVTVTGDSARPLIEVEMTDAWVWDMYRKTRFIPSVKVLSFKDVNVEELPSEDILPPEAL